MARDRASIKSNFTTGKRPTQLQFSDFIDSSVTVINVDQYGAVGDGVTDDTDAIIAAYTACAAAGERIVEFTSGKTYLVRDTIALNFIHPTAITLGYGAIIKRADEIKTTLSSAAINQTTTIQVADASVFNEGDKVFITDSSGTYSGTGTNENSADATLSSNVILLIVDNTITLTDPVDLPTSGNLDIAGEYPIGASVIRDWTLFKGSTTTPTEIYGLRFDGNRDNNTGTVSWYLNKNITQIDKKSIIHQCHFYNIPNENIFSNINIIFTGNRAYNSNGSVIHVSDDDPLSTDGITFLGNIINNVCESNTVASSHSEAVIVASANTMRISSMGNHINDCGGRFIGDLNSTRDADISMTGDQLGNLDGVISCSASDNDGFLKNLKIESSFITDCRAVHFTVIGSTLAQNGLFDGVQIKNTEFTNTQITGLLGSNIQVKDNDFILTDGYTFPVDSQFTANEYLLSVNGMNINVSGNTLDNRRVTEGTYWKYGMFFDVDNAITYPVKSDASTETIYHYHRNCKYNDNTILGFSSAFNCQRGGAQGIGWTFQGCEFMDNIIICRQGTPSDDESGVTCAVKMFPGFDCDRNKIYGSSSYDYGIFSFGVNAANATAIQGPIITRNRIVGFPNSARLGRSVPNAANDGNGIIFKDNYITSAPLDYTNGANSVISGNTTIIAETPQLQTVRQNPDFY